VNNLRPTRLADILGQDQVKEILSLCITSAKERNTCLGHTVFYGPPGTGKTTLANAIANEMGCSIQIANGANLRSIKNILPYLMRLESNSILFIDEIHRMTPIVEEFLYPVMEDGKLDMSVGGKDGGETISLTLPKFTLAGATTEVGSLSKPLIDRFQHKCTLTLYNKEELKQILYINARKLDLQMSDRAIDFIAQISRGTPRVAISLLQWARDYCLGNRLSEMDFDSTVKAMDLKNIDAEGMIDIDRKYLETLGRSSTPLGLETISCMSGIDRQTIEGMIEPWLLQTGKILKTTRGRVLA